MSQRSRVDTAVEVETPEGIDLELRPAGVVPRGLAWVIDLLIRFGLYLAVAMTIGAFGQAGAAIVVIIMFFIEWFYPVVGEVWFNGITPGKRAVGIRVVRDDGAPVGIAASLVRNLLRAVDFLPLMNAFGVVSMIASRKFQRLGDLAAGTLVVYDPGASAPLAVDGTAPRPPPFALHTAEQQLILDFADRSRTLSEARQSELAECAGVLVRGSAQPALSLRAYAAWLGGGSKTEVKPESA